MCDFRKLLTQMDVKPLLYRRYTGMSQWLSWRQGLREYAGSFEAIISIYGFWADII